MYLICDEYTVTTVVIVNDSSKSTITAAKRWSIHFPILLLSISTLSKVGLCRSVRFGDCFIFLMSSISSQKSWSRSPNHRSGPPRWRDKTGGWMMVTVTSKYNKRYNLACMFLSFSIIYELLCSVSSQYLYTSVRGPLLKSSLTVFIYYSL